MISELQTETNWEKPRLNFNPLPSSGKNG